MIGEENRDEETMKEEGVGGGTGEGECESLETGSDEMIMASSLCMKQPELF